MTETATAPHEVEFLNSFRETAQKTARPDAWQETHKSLPSTDDPIFTLIETKVREDKPETTEDELIDITEEYEGLWRESKLPLDPQTIDHQALVDFFLEEKRLLPKEAAGITRRDLLIKAGQLGVTLATTALGLGRIADSTSKTRLPESSSEQLTVFDEFIKSLKEETLRRRAERAKFDPEYYHRIDRFLNEDEKGRLTRINALLLSTGTLLSPHNYLSEHTTNLILSLDLRNRTVDLVSISSETRAPNIERHIKNKDKKPQLSLVNSAFDEGQETGGENEGFNLARETFEQATGLSMDLQLILPDGIIKDFVDQVLDGRLLVDIPYDVSTYKVDIDGVEYPAKDFTIGPHLLDGARTVQLMKGEHPKGKWKKGQIRHNRKNIIINSIIQTIKRTPDKFFPILNFIDREIKTRRVKKDFNLDFNQLFNLGALSTIKDDPTIIGRLGFNDLRIGQTINMVNRDMGGEGVRYVGEDREENPITAQDIASGVYLNHYEGIPGDQWWSGITIPYNGNPYADDLVTHYWGETRKVIRKKLAS